MSNDAPLATADLTKMRPAQLAKQTSDEVAARLHEHIVGKTVLITGVSPKALGAEAARAIALHAPKRLILASRTPAAIAQVIGELQAAAAAAGQPPVAAEALVLDLSDQASVRAAVASLVDGTAAAVAPFVLDVLINNAAVMMIPTLETVAVPKAAVEAGAPARLEKQFATNHLGHFLLANLLLPALQRSTAAHGGGRVVTVTSRGFVGTSGAVLAAALADPAGKLSDTADARAAYDGFRAYALSKAANALFTAGLARRQRPGGRGVLALTVDPGAVATTNVARSVPMEQMIALGWFLEDGTVNPSAPFISAAQSVGSYIMAAFDPALDAHNGATITSAAIDTGLPSFLSDAELADRLWACSETLVGETFRTE